MSVTYLDTLVDIAAAGDEGLLYSSVTRAMKRHVLSMAADGLVAAFLPSGETVSFDTDGAVVCLTASGADMYTVWAEAGIVVDREAALEHGPSAPAARKQRKAKRQAKSVSKPAAPQEAKPRTVPTALESVSPMVPAGHTARRVPGNQHGDQLLCTPLSTDERFAALEAAMERKFSALLAAMEATSA